MIYFGIKDYQEFKELFGKRVCNNGNEVRSNALLLTAWKDAFRRKDYSALRKLRSMADLYPYVLDMLYSRAYGRPCYDRLKLQGLGHFYSPDYATDDMEGVCADGDFNAVRYVRRDNGRVFKMKGGKFFRHLIENAVPSLCEQLKVYACETFVGEWSAARMAECEGYELEVDDDFERIYSLRNYAAGDFGSCMTNDGYHTYYENCVKAKAASLWKDGYMYARCIIFTEVNILTGKHEGRTVRLAERQYAAGKDEQLMRVLVEKLIRGGYIDGYKKVGAGCHDTKAFVWNDGTPLTENMSIWCFANEDDYISYQDTFKYYCQGDEEAYNSSSVCYDYDLSVTDGGEELFGRNEECVYVYYRGSWHEEYVSRSEIEDNYTWIDRFDAYYESAHCVWSSYHEEYIPDDEYTYCEYIDDYVWNNAATWSDILDSNVPDVMLDEYEEEFMRDNWEWDEVNEAFAPEVIEVNRWNDDIGCYDQYMTALDETKHYTLYEGKYYDIVCNGVPLHLLEMAEAI